MTSLDDRVVLVTGASGGIGEATARLLAARGAKVFLGARSAGRLGRIVGEITAGGGAAGSCVVDVSSRESSAAFVGSALEAFGRVDVLVNNAGVMLLAPVGDLKVDEWDQMVDVNLRGVLNCTAAVLSGMRERHRGMVLNVCSTAGYRVSPGAAVYSATKYAVRAFSDGLRKEESDNGIRVCLVAPGPTRTGLLGHVSDEGIRESLTGYVDRCGMDARDVAEAICYEISVPPSASVDELVISPTRKVG